MIYIIYGIKLTKSEPQYSSTNFDTYKKGGLLWNGENLRTKLGSFEDYNIALHFAENVKNNTSKKSYRITLEYDSAIEEISYTIKEDYNGARKRYK